MTAVWFVHGNIADGSGDNPFPADVCVSDDVITQIGRAPADAATVELDGMLLTPGLIDAHVHLGLSSPIRAQFGFQLSIAELAADIFANAGHALDAGFTTLRDTGGIDRGVVEVLEKGKVRGPRVLSCGPVQCQTGGHGYYGAAWEPTEMWESHHLPGLVALSLMSGNADELRRNVRESFRRGATFLKLCVTGGVVGGHDHLGDTQFTVEEIAVAVEEARARGTYVTVHAHNNAGIRNAVLAGVRCIEHGTDIDEPTAELMSEHDVALVPTFAVINQLMDVESMDLDAATRDRVSGVRERMAAALKTARSAGVRIGLGTDLIGPHQERRGEELRLRAELESPMQALVSATRDNADILGIGDSVGMIRVGMRADLVGWRKDPLEDASVFADPNMAALVVKAGRIMKGDAR
ncbi:imidazolonepropionase-like amidohydrolase [Microbacterium terrae]|uniref:Imidazolonepropionase n=1 Tax=Microbacterium terrae TaxID=69369 RepID=A0A0M2HBP7_9MICO|nr:amidohydrolase family protein [Microbacterium terrae]KJL43919.1 Imidazolonepropionase [Microbacterium terrae]MBP1078672.1 imidazolonepropionase-like amidohydrolase [Microbacterium terrae]GLJ98073.1 peptidase M38 [Microbacterium terrae]